MENESREQADQRRKEERIRKKYERSDLSKTSKSCKKEYERFCKFKERTLFGPSYPCVVCHQMLFQHQVTGYDEDKIENFIKMNCPKFASAIINTLKKDILLLANKNKNKQQLLTNKQLSKQQLIDFKHYLPEELRAIYFICKICVQHIRKNMLPPKSVVNSLASVFVPEEARLRSYLEEALIARVLLFIKIFSLRTSLMPAMKDKCIVIPLESEDISDTIDSLPRIPSQSGIIDIQWKRRLSQKTSHLQAKVCPDRIFNALNFLKDSGNKFYQQIHTRDQYEKYCMEKDPVGFNIIFGEKILDRLVVSFLDDDTTEPILNLPEFLIMRKHEEDENQLINDDPVRKFQINYNNDLYMVPKYPEGMTLDGVQLPENIQHFEQPLVEVNDNQVHTIAPGEGKVPIDIVYCKDWDAKAFPMLFPDGKNTLFDENREKKIRDQDFFCQRLFNIDPRWRNNIHWIFAATGYREKKDFKGNIDLAFKRGKKHITPEGSLKYHLENPYSVFQGVLNTPAYHKKGKFETLARLDNYGPFNVFFTLSCADYRWPENVAAVLREQGIGLRCSIDSRIETEYEVINNGRWMPLDEYVTTEMDKSVHTLFRKNIVTATRIYEQKVKSLMQNIICSKTNPLSVKHYTLKLEFAGRGAGHNHGILWLDICKIERKIDEERLKKVLSKNEDSHANISLASAEDCKEILNDYLISRRLGYDNQPDKDMDHRAFRYLRKLVKRSLVTNLDSHQQKILDELKTIFPLFGLQNALKALRNTDELPSEEELSIVAKFVDIFSTVNIHPTIVGKEVSSIATDVNQHKHTKACRKYRTTCRFNFPKFPSYRTVIAKPANKMLTKEEKGSLEKKYNTILKKVKECLIKKDAIQDIMVKYPKSLEQTFAQAIEGRKQRINALLDMAGLITVEEKEEYEQALAYSSAGYTIVHARDIDEIWVNSFNKEITRAWNGNTDFQIVLDFYAIITYIFEYFTKDDTGVLQVLVNTLRAKTK